MSKKLHKHHPSQQRGFDRRWIFGGIAILAILVVAGIVLLGQNDADKTETVAAADLASEVSVAEAAELRDQGALILDVREPEEWDAFHVPNSTLIPLGELPDRLSEVPSDQKVVVVCRSGNRSQEGRDILQGAGFTQVTSMAGGLNEWQTQGYPIE